MSAWYWLSDEQVHYYCCKLVSIYVGIYERKLIYISGDR